MNDSGALQGRHALVTGGGRGIGASIVRSLVSCGARVSMLGRTAATLQALAAELKSSGAQTFCATADVSKRESVDAAFAAARTLFGPIEILINNAGQAISAPITKRDDALWERLLAINLSGTYFGMQAALPYVDLMWVGILTFIIGLILSSAFSAIVVFAQELMPGNVGAVSGLFFGFAFGIGGIGAAVLGGLADSHGIEFVYRICAFLPLLGMVAAFLPNIEHRKPH